jgi:hypothetical protein
MSIFERVTRRKLRFATDVGNASVEDLWDLDLVRLDKLAQTLHAAVQSETTVSFIDAPNQSEAYREDKLRFDVVKRVIEVRLGDRDRAEKAATTRAKNDRIRELIAQKQDETLADKSVEELEAMLVQ